MSTVRSVSKWTFPRVALGALALAGAFALWNAYPTYSVANEALAPFAEVDTPASFANVIEAVRPAVVNIAVKGRQGATLDTAGRDNPGDRGGQAQPYAPQLPPGSPFEDLLRRFFDERSDIPSDPGRPFESAGTGFIVDPDGLVVTNYHVVTDAESITVTMDDGTRHAAVLRGYDEKTDLALLEIDGTDLPYVAFGDSDALRVGDWIVAIGNPFGLGGSATTGIVSARGRDIRSGPFDDFLQIDAPINRGNSGGPLFDLNGRVVGVNTAIFSPNGGNVGIGFAIPAAMAAPVIEELRANGRVERGWLGVSVQGLDDELAAGLGLDSTHGALVAEVVAGSPAAQAGVRPGDVIVSINGEAVQEVRELVRIVGASDPHDDIDVEVWRSGEQHMLRARLSEADGTSAAATQPMAAAPEAGRLGLRVEELDGAARRQLRLDDSVRGVVVREVTRDGAAAQRGLRPGDVIVGVGQAAVGSVEEYGSAMDDAVDSGRGTVVLQVMRGEVRQFVAVPLS